MVGDFVLARDPGQEHRIHRGAPQKRQKLISLVAHDKLWTLGHLTDSNRVATSLGWTEA